VKDWKDDDEIKAFLRKLLTAKPRRLRLIYGNGHAVYTLSDPRAIILKRFARTVAQSKGMLDELELMESVERLPRRSSLPKRTTKRSYRPKWICIPV
jgi:citrate synthase